MICKMWEKQNYKNKWRFWKRGKSVEIQLQNDTTGILCILEWCYGKNVWETLTQDIQKYLN